MAEFVGQKGKYVILILFRDNRNKSTKMRIINWKEAVTLDLNEYSGGWKGKGHSRKRNNCKNAEMFILFQNFKVLFLTLQRTTDNLSQLKHMTGRVR